jgi:hypothetical protein
MNPKAQSGPVAASPVDSLEPVGEVTLHGVILGALPDLTRIGDAEGRAASNRHIETRFRYQGIPVDWQTRGREGRTVPES